jgi:crossover junction endodeoxyribonuclease RusA
MAACTVQLHYRPRTVRRRDTDNLVALLKPVCDGLVAVGVVADDTPEFMSKPEPVIHAADRVTYGLWVVITGGLS